MIGAHIRMICCNQMVYRENVSHFDVQGWLRPCVEVIELIDIELLLSISNINY